MAVLTFNLMFATAAAEMAARAEDTAAPSEYEMKAAFVYNFAKFVHWPDSAFAAADSPLVIGMLGNDPFDGKLQASVKEKQIDAHPLIVRQLKNVSEVKACHILFVNPSEKKRWPEITSIIGNASVLLVSEEWDDFLQSGGMIHLFREANKVRFEINDAAARRAGLRISSKLLSLSRKPSRP